jgi:hypothetical protein
MISYNRLSGVLELGLDRALVELPRGRKKGRMRCRMVRPSEVTKPALKKAR